MIKQILHIALFFIPFLVVSQQEELKSDKTTTWESEKDYLDYRKDGKYDGPKDWYGTYPASMEDEDLVSTYGSGSYSSGSSSGSGSGYNPGIQYNPQQIQRDRERYRGFDRGGAGNGSLPVDPEVDVPEPPELPDVDAPDIDTPDIDLPDIDPPSISPTFWKVLLFIIIFVVVFILLYIILKNRQPSNKKVVADVENDWNPEVITKTELELRLEAAIEKEDYRECIRIYFTFILKELIKKSWIRWKREKTNYHYVLEMHKRPNAHMFNETVRIYDLVWYGDYKIDKDIYELLKPTLEQYYKSLEPTNE